MFVYCNNSPITLSDTSGTYPRKAITATCVDPEGNCYEPTLGEYINRIAKPVETTLDDLLAHTHSTGLVIGGSSGGMTMGKNFCLSNDNSGNFAFQESTSLGGSTSLGMGGSIGISHSITNAHDVQDLSGLSYCYGLTICFATGMSVDLILFEPSPGITKWGITVAWVYGAEFEVHASESYATSTDSWQIWQLYS